MAKLEPEFKKRNTKVLGLSIDPVDDHKRWAKDIEETQGTAPNYPIIGDSDLNVAKLYDMIHPNAAGGKRTAADNATIRSVFVVGPDKKVKLTLTYPMTTGRNFDEVLRVLDSIQLTAKHKVATPVNWKQGEDVIIAGSVSDDEAKQKYPEGWKSPQALPAHRQAAEVAARSLARAAVLAPAPARGGGVVAAARQRPLDVRDLDAEAALAESGRVRGVELVGADHAPEDLLEGARAQARLARRLRRDAAGRRLADLELDALAREVGVGLAEGGVRAGDEDLVELGFAQRLQDDHGVEAGQELRRDAVGEEVLRAQPVAQGEADLLVDAAGLRDGGRLQRLLALALDRRGAKTLS